MAVYFVQDFTSEHYDDFDGQRWVEWTGVQADRKAPDSASQEAAVKEFLDIFFIKRKTGWASVYDSSKSFAVRFAPGRDSKVISKAWFIHLNLIPSWKLECEYTHNVQNEYILAR